MSDVETLTEFGRLWAEANPGILSRVALQGYDGDWPSSHVEAAIRIVNERGAETAGVEA